MGYRPIVDQVPRRHRAVLLTFLAGAELDPGVLRSRCKETTTVGLVVFFAPFLGCAAAACYLLHGSVDASWLAGIAWSTTSVAVVYAVMLEFGLNKTEYGKTVLAACFINDRESAREHHQQQFAMLQARAAKAGVKASFVVLVGHRAEHIVHYAETHAMDHIVLGHRGKTFLHRWLLGSVSKRVIHYAHCTTAVVR